MKSLLFLGAIVLASSFAHAEEELCKPADYKDCTRVLKAKNKDTDFTAVYDQICNANKAFKCIKITIRGEPNEELAYQKTQYPKSQLFLTKSGGEDKIYVFEPREGYKPPVAKKVVEKKTTSSKTTQKKSTTTSAPSIEPEIVDPEGPHVPLEGE